MASKNEDFFKDVFESLEDDQTGGATGSDPPTALRPEGVGGRVGRGVLLL